MIISNVLKEMDEFSHYTDSELDGLDTLCFLTYPKYGKIHNNLSDNNYRNQAWILSFIDVAKSLTYEEVKVLERFTEIYGKVLENRIKQYGSHLSELSK